MCIWQVHNAEEKKKNGMRTVKTVSHAAIIQQLTPCRAVLMPDFYGNYTTVSRICQGVLSGFRLPPPWMLVM